MTMGQPAKFVLIHRLIIIPKMQENNNFQDLIINLLEIAARNPPSYFT